MKSLSIFFLLFGISLLFLSWQRREWIWQKAINNVSLRRPLIDFGMKIPAIRHQVVQKFSREFLSGI